MKQDLFVVSYKLPVLRLTNFRDLGFVFTTVTLHSETV